MNNRITKQLTTLKTATKFMDTTYMIVDFIDEIGIPRRFRKDDKFFIPDDIMNKPIVSLSAYYRMVLGKYYLMCNVVFA